MKRAEIPQFGPLQGVRVICAGLATAGPYAATMMSDFGAEVINIESAVVPDQSRAAGGSAFKQDHRNQRALALHIPSPQGREVFYKLIKEADIFIENSKGGQWKRWGITDETMWEVNPKLVIVHVTGYGLSGDPNYVERPSWDAIGQAFGTLVSVNGTEDVPMATNPYMCDATTALYASWAALAAYIRAQKTGIGDSIDCTQFESVLRGQSGWPLKYFSEGFQPARTGGENAVGAAFKAFKCQDGFVFICFGGPGIMKVGLPFFGFEWGSELFPRAVPWVLQGTEGARVLEAKINEWCAAKTVEEAEKELNEAGIPVSPVMTYAMAEKHPHYIARETFTEWETVDGEKIKGVNVVPKLAKEPGKVWRGAPKYGMDNEDILAELGYSSEEILALYNDKVLAKE
ncbi:L-carnitine CoA-transferase [Desulfitobacterium sp. LBE]|uniref:Bile acid-CoA hydrolase n=2 Tax=root TaxID=1 RepID=A0A098B3X8_DESHA|nr:MULTISPECIES: CoA transferase [Desulfitobacterium]MEA5022937.1 CoA transferase [Desulfitobacterium hafniense]TWH57096.1 L-carnitine CoA-transferase [Desulfitobacterium sp. LBE]CDX03578.1 Bile acid-CoA hydrolase [Desulfitobacterium hafniense]